MSASLSTSFQVQDGKIVLDDIDLITDGAVSELTGIVDSARWPEMFYQVKSKVQFPRMREIFFKNDTFSLHGEGDFTGHVSSLQGRPRAQGQLLQPRGRASTTTASRTSRARSIGCRIGSK